MIKGDKTYPEVGTRMRVFREHLEMSIKEFTEEMGYNYTQYINWETGTRRITIESAAKLEERYGLSLDFIFLGKLNALPHSLAKDLSDRLNPSR